MTSFRLIGATALSLVLALATPAMAGHSGKHHGHHHRSPDRVTQSELSVQDALRLGFGTGCRSFPSGYGGLYRDGIYPDNVYGSCFAAY